jgi:YHS domain-containing protein
MTENSSIPESAVDPVCGKTFDPRKIRFTSSYGKDIQYFCSDECRRKFDDADKETKKSFWQKYTDRLQKTHCTRNPPECR